MYVWPVQELALQARSTAPSPGRLSREGSMVAGMAPPDSPMNMSLQSLSSSMVLSQVHSPTHLMFHYHYTDLIFLSYILMIAMYLHAGYIKPWLGN